MVKVFYKVLLTTTLSLVFVAPSFSMDAHISLEDSESSGTSPFLKIPDLNEKVVTKKPKKARKHFEKLKEKLESTEHAWGSKEAVAFRREFGDDEAFRYACQHFNKPQGQILMTMLAGDGHQKARTTLESMGFKR